MSIVDRFLKQSGCYKTNEKISPKGIVIETAGCQQAKVGVFTLLWNSLGMYRCPHFIVGKGENGGIDVFQTLSLKCRGWGLGSGINGSYNDSHIQIIICEDDFTDEQYFLDLYNELINLCAQVCFVTGLNANSIVTQRGAALLGYARGYSDIIERWFSKYGKTVEELKLVVQNKVIIMSSNNFTYSKDVENGFISSLMFKEVDDSLKSENASDIVGVDSDDTVEEFKPYRIRVTSNFLNIRLNASLDSDKVGYLKNNHIYTIVEESLDGAWGLLKNYKEDRDGWVMLKYTKKI